jgi:hypothetical protein
MDPLGVHVRPEQLRHQPVNPGKIHRRPFPSRHCHPPPLMFAMALSMRTESHAFNK